METVTNPDGTISEITKTTSKESTKKMSIPYRIFFIMANMGGIYAILMLVSVVLIKPLLNKIFMEEMANDAKEANLKGIGKLEIS